jgi:putative FmdB family regulatory protein
MPTYEYRCPDCGEVWEHAEPMAEHEHVTGHTTPPPRCPRCRSERAEPVFSAFFAKTARKS